MTNNEKCRKIADYCKRPELESMLMDERLAYFAMTEVEKAIEAPHTYNEQLEMVVLGYLLKGKDAIAEFMVRCATADQRFHAFGLTLNLWEA